MAGTHSRRTAGAPKRRWLRGVGASLLVLAMAPWLGLAGASAADSTAPFTVELKTDHQNQSAPYGRFVDKGDCSGFAGTGTLFHFVFTGSSAAESSDTPNITAIDVTFAPSATYSADIIQNGQQVNVVVEGTPTLVTAVATLDRAYDRGELVLSHVCLGTGTTKQVETVSPTFTNSECTGTGVTQASYTIKATEGVDYQVGGTTKPAATYDVANGTSVTVTAVAKTGFTLTGQTSFTHDFPTPVCSTPVGVTAVTPTFTNAKCTENGQSATVASYTIPTTTGVDYSVNGSVKAAGTYTVGNGIDAVTVNAAAQAGFVLSGTATFSHTFPNVVCESPTTPSTPVTPVVNVPVAPVAPVAAPVVAPVVAPVAAPVVAPVAAPVVAPVVELPIVEGVKVTNTTPSTKVTGSPTPTQSETVQGVKVEATTAAAIDTLPRTGSEVGPLLAISGLLLLAGMTLLRLSGTRFQRAGKH